MTHANMFEKAMEGASAHRKAILESPEQKNYFEELKNGQKPDLFVIGCSDSRYSATNVFDLLPGHIFEMQVLGALMPSPPDEPIEIGKLIAQEWACVAYAVMELKVKHLLILGHTGCGAVGGIMAPDTIAHNPAVAAHLHQHRFLKEQVDHYHPGCKGDQKSLAAVGESVLSTYEKVMHFEPVKKAAASGELEVHALVYEIGNHGAISAWEPSIGAFELKNAMNTSDVSILPKPRVATRA